MEKYGFVYIWYDRKHKRYYIGSHWGTETDGYICSSNWMRDSYKRRPTDFKRKIIKIINDRKQLLIEEYKYLSLIKEEELGKKYYNLTNHLNGHWTTDENKFLTVGEKISLSHKKHENWGHWSIGKSVSEETKEKIREANRKQFEDQEQREMRRRKSLELWADPEYRRKQIEKKIGKKDSDETKEKKRKSMLGKNIGKKCSEEQKRQISETLRLKFASGEIVSWNKKNNINI